MYKNYINPNTKFAEYTTFITLHKDSSLTLSNSDKDACKSAFFRHKIHKVDQQNIPHVVMYLYQLGT